jgi:hypothetical protein
MLLPSLKVKEGRQAGVEKELRTYLKKNLTKSANKLGRFFHPLLPFFGLNL